MKTEQSKKAVIKIEAEEGVKSTRKALKTLQPTAVNKENLVDRPLKEAKIPLDRTDLKKSKITHIHKATQTDQPSVEYWKRLAEKRQKMLDERLEEIEKRKCQIELLQEESKTCKKMLEEARHLVKVLQEILNKENNSETETK